MKDNFFKSINIIERLHRLLLDVLKVELKEMNINDINNIQCLILYNLKDKELIVTDLTNLGIYLGSNVNYNLKKLIKNGYIIKESNDYDKRSNIVKLSMKGLDLLEKLLKHGIDGMDYADINLNIYMLETFWKKHFNR